LVAVLKAVHSKQAGEVCVLYSQELMKLRDLLRYVHEELKELNKIINTEIACSYEKADKTKLKTKQQ
jgi:hypothetical protein